MNPRIIKQINDDRLLEYKDDSGLVRFYSTEIDGDIQSFEIKGSFFGGRVRQNGYENAEEALKEAIDWFNEESGKKSIFLHADSMKNIFVYKDFYFVAPNGVEANPLRHRMFKVYFKTIKQLAEILKEPVSFDGKEIQPIQSK